MDNSSANVSADLSASPAAPASHGRAARKVLRIYLKAILAVLLVGGFALSFFGGQKPGSIDISAAKRLRHLCAGKPDCEVTLHDIIPGDYDTFYEFGPYQQQPEVNDALGTSKLSVSDLQRMLVFFKNGKMIDHEYADFGMQYPLNDEVVFEEEFSSPAATYVRYPPTQRLNVTFCKTRKTGPLSGLRPGTYYLLTPAPLAESQYPECQKMY